jgi:hypothetical protein
MRKSEKMKEYANALLNGSLAALFGNGCDVSETCRYVSIRAGELIRHFRSYLKQEEQKLSTAAPGRYRL